jgi:hypothetical protein
MSMRTAQGPCPDFAHRALGLILSAVVLSGGATVSLSAADPEPGLSFDGVQPISVIVEHLDGLPFKVPRGLFYDREHDEIFLADSGNGLVGIFDGKGVPKFTFPVGPRRLPRVRGHGHRGEHLRRQCGIAVRPDLQLQGRADSRHRHRGGARRQGSSGRRHRGSGRPPLCPGRTGRADPGLRSRGRSPIGHPGLGAWRGPSPGALQDRPRRSREPLRHGSISRCRAGSTWTRKGGST